MSLVTVAEMNTHLYDDNVALIDRDSDDLMQEAIDTAEDVVKASMHRYDVDELFAATADDRSKYLMKLIKDLAAWEFLRVANANVNMEVFRAYQEDARKDLERIEMGKKVPNGWPQLTDPVNVSEISVVSGTRRETRF